MLYFAFLLGLVTVGALIGLLIIEVYRVSRLSDGRQNYDRE